MLNFSGLRENLASFSFLSPFKNNMSLSRVHMDVKGQQNPVVHTRTSTASQQHGGGGGVWSGGGLTKRHKDTFLPVLTLLRYQQGFLNSCKEKAWESESKSPVP